MATPRASKSPPAGLHRIAAVARATGVSEHALRIWERRYTALASHRSDAGYRLYTDGDIKRVSCIKGLLDLGYAIGEVAPLAPDELDRLARKGKAQVAANPGGAFSETMRARFIEAVERFEQEEANRLAAICARTLKPFELVTEVIGPLFKEIGVCWQEKRLTVAQEHAATAVLRGHLDELLRGIHPARGGPVIIATTPSGELHEFGVLIASVVAASAGARVIYLGPNTPSLEIAAAVERAGADTVMISAVCLEESQAATSLLALRRALPDAVKIWAGGAAITQDPRGGITWVRTLDELRNRTRQRIH